MSFKEVEEYLNPVVVDDNLDYTELSEDEMRQLDYDGLLRLLEGISFRMLSEGKEFAKIAGVHAELQARQRVYREVKTGIQSALRARMGG